MVRVSRDARLFATASDDRSVRVWSAQGEVRQVLQASVGVVGIDFSPDGGQLALGDGRQVRVYPLDFSDIEADPQTLVEESQKAAGMRLDQVKFDQGVINSTLAPWDTYNGNLDSHTWQAVSPRVGLSYQMLNDTRLYASFGKAFRGSILDDLCRSGWMWVGPKIANPYLEPETMTNAELGLQQSMGGSLLKLTGYYAIGRDFLYYVDTDQTIFGGRFILKQRQNVARVEMKGIETSVQIPVNRSFDLSAGLTISRSVIDEFPEQTDLEGKALTYSPQQKGKVSLGFHHFLDGSVTWEWVGKQYTDDQNTDEISAYDVLHLSFSKRIVSGLQLGLIIRNVFDTQYLQSEISLDPGRIVLGSLTYEFDRGSSEENR